MTGFAGTFFLLQLVRFPLFWYHPLERAFVLESRPHTLAMDFYGRTLWSALVGGALYPLGLFAGARVRLDRERAWLWVGYGLGLTVLAVCLIGYQIWPRPPNPLPIPDWYRP